MDTIQLEVTFATPPGFTTPELALDLAVNGTDPVARAGFPIDILALYNSMREAGEHFIWTCSCGVPGCAGITTGVYVSHTPEAVIWQVPKVPFERASRFEFPKAPYVAAVTAALTEYIRYVKAYSAAGLAFEAAHDWQLSEVMTRMAKP